MASPDNTPAVNLIPQEGDVVGVSDGSSPVVGTILKEHGDKCLVLVDRGPARVYARDTVSVIMRFWQAFLGY